MKRVAHAPPGRHRAVVLVAMMAMQLVCISGCATIQSVLPGVRAAEQLKLQTQERQARGMRFADEYVGRVVEETTRFRADFPQPDAQRLLSNWMLTQSNSAYTIAAGPSPFVNVLDLVTLAVLSRMVVEDSLIPQYPEQGAALLALHRDLEAKAWKLTDDVLTPTQVEEFRGVLAEWRRQNPQVNSVAFIHFMDFAKAIGRPSAGETARPGGLFALLGLDPLAGLDPAVRQLEQTRLLAERTIYYLQRVPYILNLQVDRASSELLARPEVNGLLRDSERISGSVERFAGLAEELPAKLTAEREAMIEQLFAELSAQQQTLRPLLVELRAALEAGDATATSVDSLIQSIDRLLARFPASPPDGAAAGPGFDIRQYTTAAAEFGRTAQELQRLVRSIDAQAPALAGSLEAAVSRIEALVDGLFWRVALLLVLLVVAVLLAALAWRRVTRPRPAGPVAT
jgi:HAMP domain-containing protein